MRNVIFAAPFPMETTLRFARAAAKIPDVRLLGIWQQPPQGPDARLFHDVVTVSDAMDPNQLAEAVELLTRRHGRPHRLLGVLEQLQTQLAKVRRHLDLPGMTPEVSERFRDKALMKDALRAAGLPCARHLMLRSPGDGWSFVQHVGLPIVLKPPAGAGCRATYKIESPDDLRDALAEVQPSPQRPVLAEEFLTGEEHSFETFTLGGRPLFHSIGRYYPAPLEVMRSSWIQWVCLLPRHIDGPEFDEARRVGFKCIQALGLDTGITHMEWFRRPDGSVAIGEIAARPPGAQIVRLMSYAYDVDMYRTWARLMIDAAFDGPWERKYSVACAFLRGSNPGTRVASIEGLDEAQQRMGKLVVEAELPRVGQARADGYEGEGFAIVRHPDTEVVKKAVLDLIQTVKIKYA